MRFQSHFEDISVTEDSNSLKVLILGDFAHMIWTICYKAYGKEKDFYKGDLQLFNSEYTGEDHT